MDLRRNIWIMKNFPSIQSKFVISNPNESSISLANPFFVCVFVFVIDFFVILSNKFFAVIHKLKKILHVRALNYND